MKYTTKATDIELSVSVQEYIGKKMAALDKIAAHFEGAVTAQVEAGRTTRHHRTGDVFRVEIMVHVKGGDLRAEATGKTVLEAMDKAQEDMRTELERLKEKSVDSVKTGGRAIKKLIKGE